MQNITGTIKIVPDSKNDDSFILSKMSKYSMIDSKKLPIIEDTVLTQFIYLKNAIKNHEYAPSFKYETLSNDKLLNPVNIALNKLLELINQGKIDLKHIRIFIQEHKFGGIFAGRLLSSSNLKKYEDIEIAIDEYVSELGENVNVKSYLRKFRCLHILRYEESIKTMSHSDSIKFLIDKGKYGQTKYTVSGLVELADKNISSLDIVYNELKFMSQNLDKLKNSLNFGVYIAMLEVLLIFKDKRVFEFKIPDGTNSYYSSFKDIFVNIKSIDDVPSIYGHNKLLYSKDYLLLLTTKSIRYMRDKQRGSSFLFKEKK